MSKENRNNCEAFKHIKYKLFPPEQWQKDLDMSKIPEELKNKHLVRAGIIFESEVYITDEEYADIVKLDKITTGMKEQILKLIRKML